MRDKLVYVVADYGDLHDLAFAEVTQRLYKELQDAQAHIKSYAVPAFDTVATGFVIAQLAVNSQLGDQHKFFVNTAPRKDDLRPRVKEAGEGFAYVKLHNDIELCVVNSGFSLSFVKDSATEIRAINCAKEGSQFRSRDIFPPAFAKIFRGDYTELGADISEHIPEVPRHVLCYTDGYGNMKVSVASDELDGLKGQDVVIDVNGQKRVAKVTDGIFGVADGQLCFAPGSSGWTLPDGTKKRFSEIVMRGGHAAEAFGFPAGGSTIEWQPA